MLEVENCITLICFTVLAVLFEHWWIVLFAGLFLIHSRREG